MSERDSDKTPKVSYSEAAGGLVSAVPLCADKDGNLVPCDSPEANTQVAGAGVPIPPKLAKLYGLHAARAKEEEPEEAAPEQLPAARPEEAEAEPKPSRVMKSQK